VPSSDGLPAALVLSKPGGTPRSSPRPRSTTSGYIPVSQSGRGAVGEWIYTLSATNLETGWSELVPVMGKSQREVMAAFARLHRQPSGSTAQPGLPNTPILGSNSSRAGSPDVVDLSPFTSRNLWRRSRGEGEPPESLPCVRLAKIRSRTSGAAAGPRNDGRLVAHCRGGRGLEEVLGVGNSVCRRQLLCGG
jgi:hypothetical protein